MKLNKYYEKMSRLIDDQKTIVKYAQNEEDHCYFSDNDYMFYCISGNIASTNSARFVDCFSKIARDYESGATLAKVTRGKRTDTNNNVLKLQVTKENTCYIQEKFTKHLPANTDYYIHGRNKPVICSIWENGVFNLIAIIMPILLEDDLFRAR